MKAILIILSYGARYEVPVFTAEQAESYIKEYNEDNGFCYLYALKCASQDLKNLANGVFDTTESFRKFINEEREFWINSIKDRNIPTYYHRIGDFKLESVFAY